MTLPENPFFFRELRQFARLRQSARHWLLGYLGLMLLMVCIGFLVTHDLSPLGRSMPSLDGTGLEWLLMVPHISLCLGALGYGGDRIFSAEFRSATLLEVLILPYSAGIWLALKLVFPLCLFLAAWVCGVPFYFLAVLLKELSWATAISASSKLLFGGVGLLIFFSCLPPEYLKRWRRGLPDKEASIERGAMADGFTHIVFMAIPMLGFLLWQNGFAPWVQWRSFYTEIVPEGYLWITAGTAILWAFGQTAAAAVDGGTIAARRATRFRGGALCLTYYVAIGLYWMQIEAQHQLLYLAVFPLGVFLLRLRVPRAFKRSAPVRQEDPGTPRELESLAAWWDNAVFLKDSRVYGRTCSLRRSLLQSAGSMAAVGIVAKLLSGYFGGSDFARHFGIVVFFYVCNWIFDPSQRMTALWVAEAQGTTLLLLFISPLTSKEILQGRLWAAMVYGWLARPAMFLLLIGGFVWMMLHAHHGVVCFLLSVSPLVLSLNILSSAFTIKVRRPVKENVVACAAALLQFAVFFGPAVLITKENGWPRFAWWSLALVFFALNFILARFWFAFQVAQLEKIRTVEMLGLDESKNA